MADLIGEDRPVITCPICLIGDDHPKHAMLAEDGSGWRDYHLDCHAPAGCGYCERRIQERPDGAVGQAMLDHLVARVEDGRADGDNAPAPLPGEPSATSADQAPAPLEM